MMNSSGFRRIICAGMQRSGSTWQYNAVRSLFHAAGHASYGAWIKDYDPARPENLHIVKTHFPGPPTGPGIVVTSHRDLRHVTASMLRMGWLDASQPVELEKWLRRYIVAHGVWSRAACHVMTYETMKADPRAELARLSRALGLELTQRQIEAVDQEMTNIRSPEGTPTGRYTDFDSETLLHPGHRANAVYTVDPELRRRIGAAHWPWLRLHGYPVDLRVWNFAALRSSWQLARQIRRAHKRRQESLAQWRAATPSPESPEGAGSK